MAVTRKQALAFFKSVVSTKNVQAVSEGFLGLDEMPTMDDVKSRSAGQLDKCENFIAYVKSCIKIIDQEISGRERQGEIDFEKPGSKKKKTADTKKKVKSSMEKFKDSIGKTDGRKKAESTKKASKTKVAPKLVTKKTTKKGGGK